MELEAYIAKKRDMEAQMQRALQAAVAAFHAETGLTPRHIWVDLLEHATIHETPRYFVSKVETEVPL